MTRETELSKTSIDLCFANFECKLPVDKKKQIVVIIIQFGYNLKS